MLANPIRHSTVMYQDGSIRQQAGFYRSDRARSGQTQYQRVSPSGRFLNRFMVHMYWLG